MKLIITLLMLNLLYPMKEIFAQKHPPSEIENVQDLCGTDNRIQSNNNAVCRINAQGYVGTGWILFDGRIVTAAHIAVHIDGYSYVEFNIPYSVPHC
jgi:5-formaminoimidazole-4-carboxamide-1-beta-D-ribofuranosyl 5'-monophosphate synthetase